MIDAYTYISKPTDATYTNINTVGKEQYDQTNILYDDPAVFYDGVDQTAYTNVAKPTGGTTNTIFKGMATGLLIPPTYATQHVIDNNDPYTYISKPIN